MNCPVCKELLKNITYQGEKIDICAKCGGMWFDKGELQRAVNSLLSEKEIDSETLKTKLVPKPITIYRGKQPIRKCPVCETDMMVFNYSYN